MARRSARLWAADNDLQPLQSLVSASCLAAYLREDGGRWPHSDDFLSTAARQSAPLGERLKKGEFEEAIGPSRVGRTSKISCLADDCGRPVAFALTPGKNEGTLEGSLRRRPRARRRRAATTDQRRGHAACRATKFGSSASGEQKYYLANLPPDADLKTLAATIKAALGLRTGSPAAQGRTRPRPLRRPLMARSSSPALMTMIPYAFLQHLRLAAPSGGKKNLRRPASTDAAGHTKSGRRRPRPRSALPMPTLPPASPQTARMKVLKEC